MLEARVVTLACPAFVADFDRVPEMQQQPVVVETPRARPAQVEIGIEEATLDAALDQPRRGRLRDIGAGLFDVGKAIAKPFRAPVEQGGKKGRRGNLVRPVFAHIGRRRHEGETVVTLAQRLDRAVLDRWLQGRGQILA